MAFDGKNISIHNKRRSMSGMDMRGSESQMREQAEKARYNQTGTGQTSSGKFWTCQECRMMTSKERCKRCNGERP